MLGRDGSLDIGGMAGRCDGIDPAPGSQLPAPDVVDRCLHELDVRSVIRYHPGDRFWSCQIIESMLLLGLAGVCVAIAFAALHRRAA